MRKRRKVNYFIETASQNDIDEILKIEISSSPSPWNRKFFQDELSSENSVFLISRNSHSDKIFGYLIFREYADFLEINNIVVSEKVRRTGIGSSLMDFIFKHAEKKNKKKIFLEVRESNSEAIEFYRQFGFSKISKRQSYYRNPSEAALVFELII